MTDVFLSYARADRACAEKLAQVLRARGWSVWIDSSLSAGEYWDEKVQTALQEARSVVVLWSHTSIHSHWVRSEAEQARQRGILVPARIESVELPYGYARLHTAELTGWRGDESHRGLSELLAGVVRILGAAPVMTPSRQGRRLPAFCPLVAGAVGLVGAVSFLSIVHRDWTAVSLEVNVSSMSFTSERAAQLSDLLVVSDLAAVGVKKLELPRTTAAPGRRVTLETGPGIMRLSLDGAPRQGSITLAPLPTRAGSRVSMFTGERQREFSVRIDRNDPVTVNVEGTIKAALNGPQWEWLDFGFPKPLIVQPGENGIDLAFHVRAPVENIQPAAIPVTSLDFLRVEEHAAGEKSMIREVSTVRSGILRLDSMEQGLPLAQGEKLLLKEPRGKILQIKLGSDHMTVRFDGTARSMVTCVDEVCQDRRTTMARWFWRQHGAATMAVGVGWAAVLVALLWRTWTWR